jgi:hypothetical protein
MTIGVENDAQLSRCLLRKSDDITRVVDESVAEAAPGSLCIRSRTPQALRASQLHAMDTSHVEGSLVDIEEVKE